MLNASKTSFFKSGDIITEENGEEAKKSVRIKRRTSASLNKRKFEASTTDLLVYPFNTILKQKMLENILDAAKRSNRKNQQASPFK